MVKPRPRLLTFFRFDILKRLCVSWLSIGDRRLCRPSCVHTALHILMSNLVAESLCLPLQQLSRKVSVVCNAA